MFRRIAGFEFRYQLKNPVFWVAAGMFLLLAFGAMASTALQLGAGGNVHKNSPVPLLRIHFSFILFFMFVTTAFVANVVVRDDETGFGSIIRSTRITKLQYLGGRFVGASAAAALAFLAVPVGLFVGTLMPWLDPATLGPVRLDAYAYAFFVFGLPDLLITGAIFFAAATITRSMMWTYVCVVAFFLAWFILILVASQKPEFAPTAAILEPFGASAMRVAVRYWTPAEQNMLLPTLEGRLLINRILWIAIGAAIWGLAAARYRFAERGASGRGAKSTGTIAAPAPAPRPLPSRTKGSVIWAQLWAQMKLEMSMVFKSPAFAVLLALGAINAATGLWFGGDIFGTPTLPLTRILIPNLIGSFQIFPIIIAIYYSGELVWRDRDRRIHEIIDSTPLPDWAYIVPKTAAVAAVLIATLLFGLLVAMAVQVAKGYYAFEFGKYFFWYLLPIGVDCILYAVLAVFVQSLSPNKYVGWGIMVLYMISTVILSSLGFEHRLYQFASTPPEPVSDINGAGRYWIGAWWFRLYWIAFGAMLLVASHLLWRRGTETRLKPRLRRAPRKLKGPAGAAAAASLVVFVGTGAYAFYNTNVLNDYRTSIEGDEYLANYEKKYLKYERLPQPTISHAKFNVALYPQETKMLASGSYVLTNLTGAPITQVHVRQTSRDVELLKMVFPGARVQSDDREFGYRIYRLDRPMQPGETRTLAFETRRWQHGFRNSGNDTNLVENGTFLDNFAFAPAIGIDRLGLLRDRAKRRKYGLPAELRTAKLEDLSATRRSYFGAGWSTADITVSTDADQTPIAPGKKLMDETTGGRRTARFVSDAPILTFFSIQSARYAERHRQHAGIDLGIYYHPTHGWNVDRMLNALDAGLDYYQANFGPYQFDQVRIIEFPGYSSFAQAFANTIPYSENIGFTADTRDPEKIDYVTYVTAHELGHQYWAHQIIGADMQGATMLSETLAQYSALMVMKHLYGEDKIRRFLKYELDSYLRLRSSELVEELPLERVENQQYIHYNKGSLVMYLLQQRLGEDAVNRALRTMIARYKFKGAPYPRSIELVQAFRNEAQTPEQQALITDLFERITVYDLKVMEPKAVKRADGKWDVTVPVEARKFYAGGKGDEKETKLAEPIEIGLFTAEPGRGAFQQKNVIRMERLPIHSGRQVLRFVTDRKPTFAGVDPYNFYIDRNSEDNVAPVT